MRALVKNPGEDWKEVDVPKQGNLTALQALVGGYIEALPVTGFTAYVNEEGKLNGLAPNLYLLDRDGSPFDLIVGPIVICPWKDTLAAKRDRFLTARVTR